MAVERVITSGHSLHHTADTYADTYHSLVSPSFLTIVCFVIIVVDIIIIPATPDEQRRWLATVGDTILVMIQTYR